MYATLERLAMVWLGCLAGGVLASSILRDWHPLILFTGMAGFVTIIVVALHAADDQERADAQEDGHQEG